MPELEFVIQQAAAGDKGAFETIVQRFQDMAVGYAYAVLGDFQLAEDAAQEAFVQVYQNLAQLRCPQAFPSWFRTVVYKQCDRRFRRKQLAMVSLETAHQLMAEQPPLAEWVERNELRAQVQAALLTLPEAQRNAIVLFYIGDYSQPEIASFLDLPITTVKKRLHDAKKRLKERMIPMAQEYLQGQRPSQNEQFHDKVWAVIAPNRTQHGEAIYALLEMEQNPYTFQWRAGRLAHSHVDWSASRIGCLHDSPGEPERVITAMQVFTINMRIGSARVRTAGFNCEVTHPAYLEQRAALIEQTLAASLAAIQEQGYDLAIAFDDEVFWQKQGFVLGWRALQWQVAVVDLPSASPPLQLYPFHPDHRDDLAQIYNQTHHNLTGTAERPTYLRNKHPEMFMGWYWQDAQGKPAGYVSGGADRYFTLDQALQVDLDRGQISAAIRHQISHGSPWVIEPLSAEARCIVQHMGSQWLIEDGERQCFIFKEAAPFQEGKLQGAVFDRRLFWVDEVAGDPASCLQALGQLARQWQCQELYFDRLHYKSGVGKLLRQMNSCRIQTGAYGQTDRSYMVRIVNLPAFLTKLAPELSARLQASPYAKWRGNLLIAMDTGSGANEAMLALDEGRVTVVPVTATTHTIRGGPEIAQLLVGTESPEEIVEMAAIQLDGDASQLLSSLFPAQYPQMENQAL